MAQKQIKEVREDLNNHQSETKEYKKRDTWVKRTKKTIKEELNKDLENLRRRNQTEILENKLPIIKQKTQWKASPVDWNK
jgi:hypothetical protein